MTKIPVPTRETVARHLQSFHYPVDEYSVRYLHTQAPAVLLREHERSHLMFPTQKVAHQHEWES